MNEHKGKMSKRPRGSIHKIREFELEKISLVDEFDILQIVGEGWFGKILLVEHRASQTEMVLKAVPKPYVSLRDFYREFHYGLHLGIHRNIVTTYDVAFETAGFYIFTQEYAPLGDLTSNVTDTGVGEVYSKRVAKQIGSALDYMHTKDIVHRDVKLDNVLIYRSDFSRVKLCDFGESFQTGTTVERRNEWLPYSPPEVLDIKPEGTYRADPSHDVWQFGIVIFVCLTGCLPWQKAATDDPRYVRYLTWQGATIIRRTPKLFKLLSSKAQRMFRRFLEPRSDRRPKNLADLSKFIDDRWLAKSAEKEMAEYETDELCPSMYSFHSSPDEKHRLLYSLADCGIETNVDRQTKKNRIKDWIESSVIAEEDEEEAEETNSASPSSSVSREPVPGHISSIRATADKAKDIKTTLKDAAQKHFDPRTGALQQGPSEMGVQLGTKSLSPTMSQMSLLNNGDSLAGSLATLGSRQDLIASDLQVYSSDIELHRLGEHEPRKFLDYFRNQSLSSASLLTAPANNAAAATVAAAMNQGSPNMAAAANQQLQPGRSILQRSKSDSLKAALFASSPAIAASGANYNNNNSNNNPNNNMNSVNNSFAPNGSQYFGNNNSYNNNKIISGNSQTKQKTVTFSLANAFETLARIPLTVNASASPTLQANQPHQQQQQHQQQMQRIPHQQQNQQQQNLQQLQQQQLAWQQQQPQTQSPYFNRQQNDSQVKDSAYGSTDSRSDIHLNGLKEQQSNGTQLMYGNQSQMQLQKQHMQRSASITNTVRTQSSQQQRMYNGAMTAATMITATSPNSMKDTAYDRVNPVQNTNARKRR